MFAIKLYNKMSPFQRVIIALLLGVATGVFVGEPAGKLEIIGTAYIRLLQMTVLPYILISIFGGLGRLDSDMAANIGIKAVKIILLIWLAVMLTLLLLPFAYPDWKTAGFFSTSLTQEAAAFNFINLYIPSNIFYSLSNTIVPAVVLFSLLMGISLINVKNKETVLTLTCNLSDSLMGVASFVAKLAPLGIFAIATSAAGTLQLADLGRLQVFLWVYLTAASLLAFILLPLLIHWATPFSYREVLSTAGEAAITALATGTVLVVLPMIIERCKALLKKHDMECKETLSTVDVLVPTAYSFPSTGTLLGLGFILFSAWYVGSPIAFDQYLSFVVMGALTAFGSMAVAIPFLLDFFHLPADQFQLYLLGSVVTARVATGLAALHGFIVTLLVASAVVQRLKWQRLLQVIGAHLGISAGVMILLGFAFTHLIPYQYTGVRTFESMQFIKQPTSTTEIKAATPLSSEEQAQARLDIITKRNSIRVGYFSNALPYVFRNDQDMIVGFDMELLQELARDLNISIEIYRIKENENQSQLLADGSIDIVISGRLITPTRALKVNYSNSYSYHTMGLVLPDDKRQEFSTLNKINLMGDINLAVTNNDYYNEIIQKLFPHAKLTPIKSPRSYFKGQYKDIDAFVYPAEAGAAWAMLYPKYTAIIPTGLKLKAPVGFSLPKNQMEYVEFINTWLELKQENDFIQTVYNYWILGKNPKVKKARWSVMHDVLGWDI
jgi:Na+/H+-dicarboxylate symporter/ABC-type amino acid transport substrate-binding protein